MDNNTAQQYDAPAAGPAVSGDFASQYDSAAAAEGAPPAEEAPAEAGIDIPAGDVSQMQAIKDSGDMAALGTYVAQFLK